MILDTCALLWLAAGDKKLSRATLKKINEAPAVYVSAISGFEVAIKSQRGKLKLPLPPAEWFEQVAAHHGLTVLPLALDVCIQAAELPPIHDDPCDRFIIAAARLNDLPVVTTDERFEKYGVTVFR
ncbi:MAG: type II toxin-antitoxin system VapC family toxin [Verrucomicrobia bacterium]|jgi:PIN domain nuclease of toxin-antitoxin system|nr:type II toxin-antitoxin system VapC family toxin [Verrucomicrobiota bacterium]